MAVIAAVLFFSALVLPAAEVRVELQERRVWEFKPAGVRFNNQFSGARLNDCEQIGDDAFRLTLRPENAPINNSAWYAFQVVAAEPKAITVRLAYTNGTHRYVPKTSRDGVTWAVLPETKFQFDKETKEAVLRLDAGPEPLWVAGQEMLGIRQIYEWLAKLDEHAFAWTNVFGLSLLDRELVALTLSEDAPPRYVFIISRQHPPEITGTVALMAFVEALTADTELARRYRRNFRTLVMPLLNPDGVENGHWRHNMSGVDLNRDWKDFQQPETQAARDELLRHAKADGARAWLLLDFHSTRDDVFYTQTDREETFPPGFTRRWLDALQRRFPDYKVERNSSHDPGAGTSKAWGHRELGIPSITCELGDHTPRELIRRVARGAAEEMMKLLLEGAEAHP